MHDLTFTNEIISALNIKQNSTPNGSRITSVSASLSPLSHVKPETLTETFNAMVKGTEFEDIKLTIKVMPLEIKCRSCNHQFNVDKPTTKCPKCDNSDLDILYCKEFIVDSITI